MSLRLAFIEIARVATWLDLVRRRPSILQIQAAVCQRYHLRPVELASARRAREIVRPRQIAMYLCRELTPRSLPQIGRAFGGRDHTTVIHACRKIERLRAEDRGIDTDIAALVATLEQGAAA